MHYEEFQLLATNPQVLKEAEQKLVTFQVQVPLSPAGEKIEGIPAQYDTVLMRDQLDGWEQRELAWPDVLQVGALLAEALLPGAVRELLVRSLDIARTRGHGLRLRLRLHGVELHQLPWEYVLLNRAGNEATPTDFLGLMPDVSIVRHESATIPPPDIKATLPAKLIAAFVSTSEYPKLALDKERHIIVQALQGNSRIEPIWREKATRKSLLDDVGSAHFFHFAGHGEFRTEAAEKPGALEGEGLLIFDDGFGDAEVVSAYDLARALRAVGVRVAVVGACLSGRRDDMRIWSSVATAMLKAELGAVVAMQHTIRDDSAMAFAGEFYKALVAGLTLDEAVTKGRLEIANAGDIRGWGTPVLYLRAEDGQVFTEYANDPALDTVRQQLHIEAIQRFGEVQGKVVGIRAKVVTAGELIAIQNIDKVAKDAQIIGVEADHVGGGSIHVNQTGDTVAGNVTGVSLDTVH